MIVNAAGNGAGSCRSSAALEDAVRSSVWPPSGSCGSRAASALGHGMPSKQGSLGALD